MIDLVGWISAHSKQITFWIAVIGAPGGIAFWIDKYRSRIRVDILGIDFSPMGVDHNGLIFWAENVGPAMTALRPTFVLTAYSGIDRKKYRYTCFIEPVEGRQMPPYQAKTFSCLYQEIDNPQIAFNWFMTFKFPLSKGGSARYRTLNADGFEPVGFLKFYYHLFFFKMRGDVPQSAK